MEREKTWLRVLCLTVLGAAGAASAAPLYNGGFAVGDPTNAALADGWTMSGTVVRYNGGTDADGFALYFNPGNSNPINGVVSQTFDVVAGYETQLGLDLYQGVAYRNGVQSLHLMLVDAANPATVYLDQVVTDTLGGWDPLADHHAYNFLPGVTSVTLTISDVSPDPYEQDGILDHLTVTTIPEPAWLGLLSLLALPTFRPRR